ncbi:MAG TPA: terminase family protein [Coprothermobacter proteolyticus]|nr:terminase family protein [Coprothermobacter proteolyticus]
MRYYQNNTKLKAAGVQMELTHEQIMEIDRCMDDPTYFIEKYVKIIHVDRGLIPFKLYDYQRRYIDVIHNNRFSIAKWSRQTGKSTTTVAYFLYLICFNKDKTLGILANKANISRELLGRLKLAYENLPLWLQPGVIEWNKGSIELGNGCSVVAAATSSSSIRGMSLFAILLDEFAFLHPNMADAFFESTYPVISSGQTTRIYIVSTPNGMNHFYRMWVEAEENRSSFVPVSIDWWEVPGRDEAWRKETVANIGEESFEQEYGGSFLGSSHTLIAGTALSKMVFKEPIIKKEHLSIFELPVRSDHHPDEDDLYVMTVDCSEGVGSDYSTFTVTNVSRYPFKQVATYRHNLISPLQFPDIIVPVAKQFNDAWILIEINSSGKQVADIVRFDHEYENVLMTSTNEKRRQQLMFGPSKEKIPGVRTTKSTKKIGCSNIKHLIEDGKYLIQDFHTIQEASTFVRKKDSFEAEEGTNDDMMMSLVLFGWLSNQEFFKEIANKDIRKSMFNDMRQRFETELPADIMSYSELEKKNYEIDANGLVWTLA